METTTGKEIAESKPKNEGIKTTGGQIARLDPKSFGELEHMAQVLAKSDIVPKELIGKSANVLLVLMFGNEIGLTAAQSLQNIMVVNGRPSLWGDAVMGLVLSSPVYEDSKDEFDEKTMTATFRVKRKGKDWTTRSFSQADAEKAKLWGKQGPWQQYPKRMLFHRARSWALRDAFADVLKGLRYFEEERDIINLEASTGGGKVYEMPKEKVEPIAATVQPETQAEKQADISGDGLGGISDAVQLFTIEVRDYKTMPKKDGKGLRHWSKDQEGDKYWTDDDAIGEVMRVSNLDRVRITVECAPNENKDGQLPGQYMVLSVKSA